MNKIVNIILPKTICNDYRGNKIARWFFTVLAIASIFRSLIHFLAPDGGAASIAGLDVSEGGQNIIFAFGLWGLSQLLYAFIQTMVAFRYRTLIPLFYLILIIEILGRMAVGAIKPPDLLNGAPPGAIANYILLPIAIIMFFLCLKTELIKKHPGNQT